MVEPPRARGRDWWEVASHHTGLLESRRRRLAAPLRFTSTAPPQIPRLTSRAMASMAEDLAANGKKKKEEFSTGHLSVLMLSVKNNTQLCEMGLEFSLSLELAVLHTAEVHGHQGRITPAAHIHDLWCSYQFERC